MSRNDGNRWIVTANRLGDGAVVYRDKDGAWTQTFAAACLCADKTEAESLCADAARPDGEIRVVGPYVMAVALEGDRIRPLSTREWIRAGGPSVSPERNLGL